MTSAELMAQLRRDVAARGWNRKATGRIIGELLVHIFLSLAGVAVFVLSDNWLARVCGLALVAAGSMGVGTNSHTASHYATSDRKWVNEFLTYFGYSFYLGLSATFWVHQHVTVHHAAPNVVGIDDDCDLSPWFAMTEEEARSGGALRQWYYKNLQWIFFPIALAANGFNFIKTGWLHLFRMLRDPGKRTRAHWIDLMALTLHHAVYLAVPMFFFAPGDVLAFYALRTALLGYGMFALQAPGHFPAENARLSADQRDADYLLLQTAATTNFRAGFIGRLFASGLDHQIEHHLFPNVSHVHYRKMAHLVESFCREHGLPYRAYRWDHILWKCWMVFRSPRPIVSDAETLRLPLQEQPESRWPDRPRNDRNNIQNEQQPQAGQLNV